MKRIPPKPKRPRRGQPAALPSRVVERLPRYVPPPLDSEEPLDAVEEATVDLMVAILVDQIREEWAREEQDAREQQAKSDALRARKESR